MLKLKNEINIFSLARRIKRPLILDGAMGSLLQQKGIVPDNNLWMSLANIQNPEIIFNIHKEYIKSGADIITTNTFRTNPIATIGTKYKSANLVKASVTLAKKAASNIPVFIAGSNAPAEDCYKISRSLSKKELEKNHFEHIENLIANGCHFILNETQSHFDEIKIISRFCSKNEIPFIISLFFDSNLRILSGEKLNEVIKYILDFNPLAVSFNCIMPETMNQAIKKIKIDYNWGFYLNCGDGSFTDQNIKCVIPPETYFHQTKDYLKYNPSFIGSCCGSSPLHIKFMEEYFNEARNS